MPHPARRIAARPSVERVGAFTAPISADHVYMYIHQTGVRRDDDAELEWHREREISRMQQMWEGEPRVELPPGIRSGCRRSERRRVGGATRRAWRAAGRLHR